MSVILFKHCRSGLQEDHSKKLLKPNGYSMVQAKADLNKCCNTNIDNVFRTKS